MDYKHARIISIIIMLQDYDRSGDGKLLFRELLGFFSGGGGGSDDEEFDEVDETANRVKNCSCSKYLYRSSCFLLHIISWQFSHIL